MKFKTDGHAANELYLSLLGLRYHRRYDALQMRLTKQKAARRNTYTHARAMKAFLPLLRAVAKDWRKTDPEAEFGEGALLGAARMHADRFERSYPNLFEHLLDTRRAERGSGSHR